MRALAKFVASFCITWEKSFGIIDCRKMFWLHKLACEEVFKWRHLRREGDGTKATPHASFPSEYSFCIWFLFHLKMVHLTALVHRSEPPFWNHRQSIKNMYVFTYFLRRNTCGPYSISYFLCVQIVISQTLCFSPHIM